MSKRELAGRGILWSVAVLALAGLAVMFVPGLRRAEGGTFSSHNWTNTSPSPACICDDCGCERPSETYQGVSKRTGELFVQFPIFSAPGMLTTHSFSLLLASTLRGSRSHYFQSM